MEKIFWLLLISCLSGCFGRDPEKTNLREKAMPSFNILLADSITNLNTNSIPKGRPVVLLCFKPTCPYSHAQIKEIIKNMNSLTDIQFYIFTPYPFKQMKQVYNIYELGKFANVKTGIDYKYFFKDYFQMPGYPYMAIYGKDKKLRESFVGEVKCGQIKEIAEK